MEDLREAALKGETSKQRVLHSENPLLLDTLPFLNGLYETLLHVATLQGHVGFVQEIVRLKQKFAGASDSRGSTALHFAAGNGNVEIAQALVDAGPEVCEVLDRDGLNPLHLAVINGNVDVLRVLVRANPLAALSRAGHGETILHLCIKEDQMEALKVLLVESNDDQIGVLINAVDDYGHTVLHLAVYLKQTRMVKYLLESGRIDDVNVKNANGFTAMDILVLSRRDDNDCNILDCLKNSGASRATEIPTTSNGNIASTTPSGMPLAAASSSSSANGRSPRIPKFPSLSYLGDTQREWVAEKSDTLLLMETLLAGMASQSLGNPPGGVWQDNSPEHGAGEAVIAYSCPDLFELYIYGTVIGLIACLSTILLLISGLPFKHKSALWILMVTVWVSIVSTAYSHIYAIVTITPKEHRDRLRSGMFIGVPFWCGLMLLVVHWQIILSMGRWLRRNVKMCPPTNQVEASHVLNTQDVRLQMTDGGRRPCRAE